MSATSAAHQPMPVQAATTGRVSTASPPADSATGTPLAQENGGEISTSPPTSKRPIWRRRSCRERSGGRSDTATGETGARKAQDDRDRSLLLQATSGAMPDGYCAQMGWTPTHPPTASERDADASGCHRDETVSTKAQTSRSRKTPGRLRELMMAETAPGTPGNNRGATPTAAKSTTPGELA